MIELIIFIVLVFVALIFAMYAMPTTIVSENMSVDTNTNVAPAGILLPREHVNKGLHVGFAELRSERIFSKKTGKIKYDKVNYT